MSSSPAERAQFFAQEREDVQCRYDLLRTLCAQARSSLNPDAQTVLYLDSRAGELAKLLQVYDYALDQWPAPAADEVPAPPAPPAVEPEPVEAAPAPPPAPEPLPLYLPQEVIENLRPIPEDDEEDPEEVPVFPEPVSDAAAGSFGLPANLKSPRPLPAGLPPIGPPTRKATKVEPIRKTYFYDPIREQMVWELPARKQEILDEARRLDLIE